MFAGLEARAVNPTTIMIAAAALAPAAEAPASRIDCAELRALVASARAATPFADFPPAYEARGPVIGYGAQCYRGLRDSAGTLYCQFMRTGGALREVIADDIATCLPDAVRDPEPAQPPEADRRRRSRAGNSNFRAGDVMIRIANSDPRTIIGYQIYLTIGRNLRSND